MIAKTIVVSACFAGFMICSLPAPAETFATLYAGSARGAAGTLLDNPAIARWLMTLPRDECTQTAEARSIATELFDSDPIGGEVYHFAALPQAQSWTARVEASLEKDAFDAKPIGGKMFELTSFSSAPFRAMAQNAGPSGKPALEGRSASVRKGGQHTGRHGGARASRGTQICRCMLAARVNVKSSTGLGRKAVLSRMTSNQSAP